jgi:hypothetical protein
MTSTIRIHNGPGTHWGVGVLFTAGAVARRAVLLVS